MSLFSWAMSFGGTYLVLLIFSYIFWLVMIIDAVKQKDIPWIVAFVLCAFTGFLSVIVSAIYYISAYKRPKDI